MFKNFIALVKEYVREMFSYANGGVVPAYHLDVGKMNDSQYSAHTKSKAVKGKAKRKRNKQITKLQRKRRSKK